MNPKEHTQTPSGGTCFVVMCRLLTMTPDASLCTVACRLLQTKLAVIMRLMNWMPYQARANWQFSRFSPTLSASVSVWQVAVFAPGMYELKGYTVSWTYPELRSLHDTRPGSPFLLTVEDAE